MAISKEKFLEFIDSLTKSDVNKLTQFKSLAFISDLPTDLFKDVIGELNELRMTKIKDGILYIKTQIDEAN